MHILGNVKIRGKGERAKFSFDPPPPLLRGRQRGKKRAVVI